MILQDEDDCYIDSDPDPVPEETQDFVTESHIQSPIEEDFPSQFELNNRKKRQSNFSPEEDMFLIDSWLGTSMDSVNGNDQKATRFWDRVSESYIKRTGSTYPERTTTSLISRWHIIQKAVNKFQGCFAQIVAKNKSGISGKNKIDEAKVLYQRLQKSIFMFENCWQELRKHSKWKTHMSLNCSKRKISAPISSSTIADSTNVDEGVTSSDAFVDLERPIGKKAAKEKLKQEKNKQKIDSFSDMPGFAEWNDDKKKMHEEKMSMEEKKMKIQEEKLKIIALDSENSTKIAAEKNEIEKMKIESSTKIEERKLEIEEKKVQRQNIQDEMTIMLMDTSSLDPVQKLYIESKKSEILAKENTEYDYSY